MQKNFKKVGWSKNKALEILSFFFIITCFSCEPQVEKPANGNFSLAFSADTIFFDTLFTETRSVTKRLKVYNTAEGAINIDEISLAQNNSPYYLYIKGEKGKSFNDVHLLGKDSLLILIEATIDRADENLPFIVEDNLVLKASSNYTIPLISWGQDAVFIRDSILTCNAHFTAEKPYVLFGTVLVDTLCSLNIDAGSQIYNHFNSTLYIRGTLKTNGTPEKRILFTNDRRDEGYKKAPGQWGGIYILEGSFDNNIQYTDIRNADVGIRIGNPDEDNEFDVEIGHSRIENIATTGVLSFTSDVFIHNSLINNCGISSVAAVAGGNYRFWNNTFVNYSFDFFREDASLILSDNIVLADNSLLVNDLYADIRNNIIWGSLNNEYLVSDTKNEGNVDILIEKNLIKSVDENLAGQNLINIDPLFLAPQDYIYKLDSSSVAVDAGIPLPGLLKDIEGKDRINAPDLGAFENQ